MKLKHCKNIFIVTTLWLLAMVMLNCHNPAKEQAQIISDTVVYEVDIRGTSSVSVRNVLGIISRQSIVVDVLIENPEDSATFKDKIWELQSPEGNRAHPVSYEYRMADGGTHLTLTFQPVQSRRLYQQYGLRGDIADHYQLTTTNDDHPFTASLTTFPILPASLSKFGHDHSLKLYRVALPKEFVSQQRALSANAGEHDRSFHATENEILSQGIWTKMACYQLRDSLYIDLRIVNQSGQTILGNTEKLSLITLGTQIQNNNTAEAISIVNGSRGQFRLRFLFARLTDQVKLDLSELRLKEGHHETIVFPMPIDFQLQNKSID